MSACDVVVSMAFKYGLGIGLLAGGIFAGVMIYLSWKK